MNFNFTVVLDGEKLMSSTQELRYKYPLDESCVRLIKALKKDSCPECGYKDPGGAMICPNCGYNFAS